MPSPVLLSGIAKAGFGVRDITPIFVKNADRILVPLMQPCQKFQISCLKDQLDEEHVAYGAPGDREQHLALPQMKRYHKGDGDQLGDAMAAGKEADISQTVYD